MKPIHAYKSSLNCPSVKPTSFEHGKIRLYGILNVLKSFFRGVALTVTSRKRRAMHIVTVFAFMNKDRVFHHGFGAPFIKTIAHLYFVSNENSVRLSEGSGVRP